MIVDTHTLTPVIPREIRLSIDTGMDFPKMFGQRVRSIEGDFTSVRNHTLQRKVELPFNETTYGLIDEICAQHSVKFISLDCGTTLPTSVTCFMPNSEWITHNTILRQFGIYINAYMALSTPIKDHALREMSETEFQTKKAVQIAAVKATAITRERAALRNALAALRELGICLDTVIEEERAAL